MCIHLYKIVICISSNMYFTISENFFKKFQCEYKQLDLI